MSLLPFSKHHIGYSTRVHPATTQVTSDGPSTQGLTGLRMSHWITQASNPTNARKISGAAKMGSSGEMKINW
ncbi:hypothetical protein [Deinococcus cellulosilyticus]|uniref:hypothetical protein n=1 Tax=Deinococcus cellulosilyticus TaxID=401558 RepID=UPI0011BEA63D|nr:hypothetical protein [Deinococcus cellulosilyticus]